MHLYVEANNAPWANILMGSDKGANICPGTALNQSMPAVVIGTVAGVSSDAAVCDGTGSAWCVAESTRVAGNDNDRGIGALGADALAAMLRATGSETIPSSSAGLLPSA